MLEQFPPAVRGRAPEIKTHLVETKEPCGVRENDAARLHHPKNAPQTKLKLAEVLQSAWKQDTIVSLRGQNVLAMGNIAKERGVGAWFYVHAMDSSKIVTVPARVNVLVYLQDVAGNIGAMPLKKPVDIIPIDRRTAVPPEIVREWLYSPKISPPRKPSSFNYAA
jgi:hypothetical protein